MTEPEIKTIPIEGIRLRPAMYIGDTESYGLHRILFECIENSLDEAFAGICTEINCRIFADGSVIVEDDGWGIPLTKMSRNHNRTYLECMFTEIHSGPSEKSCRVVTGGLNGAGLTPVNALSETLDAAVHQNGRMWTISFERGTVRYPLTDLCKSTRTGTTIHFKPDPDIFGEHTFDYQYIHDRFQELSGLFPGVKLNLADERTGKEAEFHCPNGLADYVRILNRDRDPLFPDVFQHEQEWDGAHIGVALQSTTGFEPIVRSFVNAGQCHEGTHIKGFRTGLKRGLHRYAVSHGLILETAPTIEHYMEGITAAISVWLEDPYYEGPTRFKLGNLEMAQAVAEVVQSGIEAWSEQCPECIQEMIDKAASSAEMDAM